MKTFISILFCLIFYIPFSAQIPKFNWAKTAGGVTNDGIYTSCLDNAGNVILAGAFTGTIDLDPGPGVQSYTSSIFADIFIMQLDTAGTLAWVKVIGGPGNDAPSKVTVDLNGDILVAGIYESTVDFDPGVGTTTVVSNGLQDVFVLKLDGQGNLIWVRSFGSTKQDFGSGIAANSSGEIFVSGWYGQTIDLDPSAAVKSYTCNGIADAFFLSLTANGTFSWAHTFGSPSPDQTLDINVAANGDMITTGVFFYTVDVDPGLGVSTLDFTTGKAFVIRYSSSGTLLWARNFGNQAVAHVRSIVEDPFGNIILGGVYSGTIDLDPGSTTYSCVGSNYDFFLSKWDQNGNFLWSHCFGGPGVDDVFDLTTDRMGEIYVAGSFSSTVDFDPAATVFTLNAIGGDPYLCKFDASGNLLHALQLAGTTSSSSVGYEVEVDNKSGAVYLSGYYYGTMDFNPGVSNYTTTSGGMSDFYVVKLSGFPGALDVGIEESSGRRHASLRAYPNPFKGTVTIESQRTAKYVVCDLLGQIKRTGILSQGENKWDVKDWSTGSYFLRSDEGEVLRLLVLD